MEPTPVLAKVTHVEGVPMYFTRRRYGTQPYCWVHVWRDGQWIQIADPYPCVTPSMKALRRHAAGDDAVYPKGA